jgi:sterol desaturase/sphingolipid hydroxylase (fatty acid hydroxylase superfamily)
MPRGPLEKMLPILALGAAATILVSERRAPLRQQTQREPDRLVRNVILGALSMVAVSVAERPLTMPLARRAEARRRGLVQRLPLPSWTRDVLAFLLMDYTIYVWHVMTHKVPALWRLHLVHHVDLDLDASTALRFHVVDMLVSAPYRAAQVALIGASPRALRLWQAFFFTSVMFHHSNLRLPLRLERVLALVLTTPRMHGIHHSTVRDETDSNWSSGLSFWDRLHHTFRLDVRQEDIEIGVPGYRDPGELRLGFSLRMPFLHQRDAWRARPGSVVRVRRPRGDPRPPGA